MKKLVYLSLITIYFNCSVTNNYSDTEARAAVFNNYYSGNLSIGDTSLFTSSYIAQNSGKFGFGKNERNVILRDHTRLHSLIKSGSGKINVEVCANRKGEPVFVKIKAAETTITDRRTLENALMMIGDYRIEPDETAPLYECGEIKLFLDLKAFE